MNTGRMLAAMLGAFVLMQIGLSRAQEATTSPFPNTQAGIGVFGDQIDVHQLTDAQAQFAATHYAGAQKLTRSGIDRLRAYNPAFVMLQYRLGTGLSFRAADGHCVPSGELLANIWGDAWLPEWPQDGDIPEDWFFHYQDQRVYSCDWGWFLMDPGQSHWREWWLAQVQQQVAASGADGVFADSVSVPNYLGADAWRPALPAYDPAFEAAWVERLNAWMRWANAALGDDLALIVNAGQLVTARETTDYALADGVMVEGFGGWGEYNRFAIGDWQLQMNRILQLTSLGRVLLLQSYVSAPDERLWTLANYLLVKGDHTFINLETSQNVEWFPEYDLPVGPPLAAAPAAIGQLLTPEGLYMRAYAGAIVLVNPDPEGAPLRRTFDTPVHWITGTVGGGDVPADAVISSWYVETVPVTEVVVPPGQAAILLRQPAQVPPAGPALAAPELQTALTAFHRSGQTFITWPELPDRPSRTYRVYRHTAPYSETVIAVPPVAELPQGSGIFWTERARALNPPDEDQRYVSLRNYIIAEDGPQLPDSTGLLVWTAHETGSFYYTVTTDDGTLLGTAGPIAETIHDPAPIRVWHSADGLSQVFTQFMDYAAYNPTYDAPRSGNAWLWLPDWEALAQTNNHQQYAYNYWVGLPGPALCGGHVPDQLPLVLHLEGWGSRYAAPADALYWCAAHVWADDPSQSWYYGFSASHDYRLEGPVLTGPIVNFTEARLLRTVDEVLRMILPGLIDSGRIYVYGHSMGGTGALMLAERYPQVFAAAAASEPMMNFAAAQMWVEELEAKWGARDLNLPVENRGSGADHLRRYDGVGVWDWQNLGAQLEARRGDEMAFIAIAHGTLDTVIDWSTVVQPAYAHFYEGNRGFIGEILEYDHTWLGFREHPNWIFERMDFPRDETFPALSHASGSLPVPPDRPGGYNLTIEWSASNNSFAGSPVDTAESWEVVLRSLDGDQTVDVTPRRLQRFVVEPALTYSWENRQLPDGRVIQSGELVPHSDGLLVVTGVRVTESGNRLVIIRH